MGNTKETYQADAETQTHLTRRDALFRQPNSVDALAWWHDMMGNFPPYDQNVPLAAVHKARLQWLDATDDMIRKSKLWLAEHGYRADWQGAEPLTPETRDLNRRAIGKPPLNEIT